jgi:hypothetical protein
MGLAPFPFPKILPAAPGDGRRPAANRRRN